MSYRNRDGKINVKLLIILILVTTALGVSLVAARQIRRSILSKVSLTEGEAAFEKGNWPAASQNLKEYLARNPDNVEILKKYAKACLSIRPLEPANVAGAISAYRRVLRLAPLDSVACEKLAILYTGTRNWEELAYIARMRLSSDSNDLPAHRWLADALVRLNKASEAQQDLEQFIQRLKSKHVERAKACTALSQVILARETAEAKAEALRQLDQAVASDANSAEALASRAQLYRQTSNLPDVNGVRRVDLARRDLERADKLGTDDPRLRYSLGMEWMAHSDLDRAARRDPNQAAARYLDRADDELQAIEAIGKRAPEVLEESFFDMDGWKVQQFLFAAELALRRKATAEGATLADEALKTLKESRHRIQVLPTAIKLYVAAGEAAKARDCLDEHLKARHTQEEAPRSREDLAFLQALVAGVESNWYSVVDILQPVVVGGTSRPESRRLLAEAFIRTRQDRHAVSTLISYLQDRPKDQEMTRQLANEYMRLRDWNRALESARGAESLAPADYQVRLFRIRAGIYAAAAQQQKLTPALFSKAGEELTQLRAEHPQDVDIRILQALIADSLEQPSQGEAELKLAVEQCQEPLRAEMELAQHYLRLKPADVNEAVRVCRDACARHPQVAEPWLTLANLHTARKDSSAARDCLQKGLDAVTDKQERQSLSIQLAVLEYAAGDRGAGIKRLSDLAAQDPQEIQARSLLLTAPEILQNAADPNRVRARVLIDELKKAEGENGIRWRLHQASLYLSAEDWRSKQRDITELLQTCIRLDPESSAPSLLLAQMYEKLNDLPHAEDTYRQALIQNPAAMGIADRLVMLLEQQKRNAEAAQVLQQVGADPRVANAWRIRTALREENFSQAVEELKLRLSVDPRDVSALILLARSIYWETKDAAQALEYVQKAEVLAPGSLAVTDVKASILREDRRTTEARKILDDNVAKRLDFNAYQMRAVYLAREGQWEQAEQDFRKLTTFPENSVLGFQLLSDFYASREDLDKAVAALKEGLKAHPQDLSLERSLMQLLLPRAPGQGREMGVEILAALEKRLPQDPELMWWRARLLLERPTPDSLGQARALLENVVKLKPTAVKAHLVLIRLAMEASEYRAALDYANRALGSNLNNGDLQLARARAEFALENYATAGDLAHLVLQEDPNSAAAIEVLLEIGQKSKNRDLVNEARTRIDAAVRRVPANEGLLLTRAWILTNLQEPKAAIPELETYCQTASGSRSIAALVRLADLYRLTGDAERSKQRIEQAQQLDPNDQMVIHARLLWLVSQKRFDELKGISTAYLSAPTSNATMLVPAAAALISLEAKELKQEGLRLLERAAALSPTSIPVQLGLASTLYQTGDATRAKELCETLRKQHPDDIRVLNNLAWILQDHDQKYDEALALADRGLKRDPNDLNLLDTRGTILAKLPERLADARSDFTRLVELSPADSPRKAKALLQLGRVCATLRNLPQAKQHLEEALEIDKKLSVFTPAERVEIAEITQKNEI